MIASNKRRMYFIDPKFQVRFIVKFCSVLVVSMALAGIGMLFLSRGLKAVRIEDSGIFWRPLSDFIFPEMTFVLVMLIVAASVATISLTLLASHKISGPILRIRKEIDLVQGGDLRRSFSIRDSDQFQELADGLQEMTKVLREKHLKIGGLCRSVSNFLEEKNLSGSQEDRDKLLRMVRELYDMLGYFKV